VLVYLVISCVLTAAWALGGGGFFWPMYLMAVWGAGVIVNGYLAYRPRAKGKGMEVRKHPGAVPQHTAPPAPGR
jgi:hypothetical protein